MKKTILTTIALLSIQTIGASSTEQKLEIACMLGQEQEIMRLIREGGKIYKKNERGISPINILHGSQELGILLHIAQHKEEKEGIKKGLKVILAGAGYTPKKASSFHYKIARLTREFQTVIATNNIPDLPHYQKPMIRDLMKGFHTTLQDKEGKTFYILTSLTKINGYYNQNAALETQSAALDTQWAALDTQWAALSNQTAALRTRRAALRTQWATIRTQGATLRTQTAALRTQWATIRTQRAALRTQETALKTQWAALDTQYALLYTPKYVRRHHQAASKGIEAVRSSRYHMHQYIPILQAKLSFSSPEQGIKTETTIGALTASFLDEKPGLNIYQAAINNAAPYIMTLAIATAWIQRVLQEALQARA